MKVARILGVAALAMALAFAMGCSQQKKSGCGCGCGQKAAPDQKAAAGEKAQTTAVEQKTCPVTGEAINKAVFTEYKGQKVYFCCKGCIAKFNKDPEKYAANIK